MGILVNAIGSRFDKQVAYLGVYCQ